MEEPVVTIPQWRYEALLDTESRVHVLVQMLMNETYVDKGNILLYLGQAKAYKEFKENEAEKQRKEQIRNASINKRD